MDFFSHGEVKELISEWEQYQKGPGLDGFTYTGSLIDFLGCTIKQYDDWMHCGFPIPRNEQ